MEYTKEQCESEIAVWKERLDNVKPNLVAGTWYKWSNVSLINYSQLHNNYGCWYGEWRSDITIISPNVQLIKATYSEIKEALIKEAKKRGFVFDIYAYAKNNLFGSTGLGDVIIFNQGKWLDPIPTHTQEELEKIVGYKFKIK